MTTEIDMSTASPSVNPLLKPLGSAFSNPFCACLLAAPREDVLSLARQLQEGWQLTPLQASGLAENGLALLQWTDSVLNQAFYLGEIPIAQAALAMSNANGDSYEGGAIIMREDSALAQAIAILDAVWRHQLPGFERIAASLASGAVVRSQNEAERKQILARTRVDFSLLSSADHDNDEADANQE